MTRCSPIPGGEPFQVDVRCGIGAELDHDPAEDPAVGAAGAGVLVAVQGGEVGVDGLAKGDATASGQRGEPFP